MSYQTEEKNQAEWSAFFDKALMPLPQDHELAQLFTNKIKEWEDKEERPLSASRMPSKDRGCAVWGRGYPEGWSI
jgi:hypothetical protein